MLRRTKHYVPLQRIRLGRTGKLGDSAGIRTGGTSRLTARHRSAGRCKEPGVYSEGLCYPCWYYRHP
jgi:hypothetical protein